MNRAMRSTSGVIPNRRANKAQHLMYGTTHQRTEISTISCSAMAQPNVDDKRGQVTTYLILNVCDVIDRAAPDHAILNG